jgi:hypothetical protein
MPVATELLVAIASQRADALTAGIFSTSPPRRQVVMPNHALIVGLRAFPHRARVFTHNPG